LFCSAIFSGSPFPFHCIFAGRSVLLFSIIKDKCALNLIFSLFIAATPASPALDPISIAFLADADTFALAVRLLFTPDQF